MKVVEFTGREVLKMKPIGTPQPYNVEEGHSMHGQTYTNFRLKGKAVSINTDTGFAEDLKQGKVWSIEVIESYNEDTQQDQYSYSAHTLTADELTVAKAQKQFDDLKAKYDVSAVSVESLADLKED